jgi:hypothetical protein
VGWGGGGGWCGGVGWCGGAGWCGGVGWCGGNANNGCERPPPPLHAACGRSGAGDRAGRVPVARRLRRGSRLGALVGSRAGGGGGADGRLGRGVGVGPVGVAVRPQGVRGRGGRVGVPVGSAVGDGLGGEPVLGEPAGGHRPAGLEWRRGRACRPRSRLRAGARGVVGPRWAGHSQRRRGRPLWWQPRERWGRFRGRLRGQLRGQLGGWHQHGTDGQAARRLMRGG